MFSKTSLGNWAVDSRLAATWSYRKSAPTTCPNGSPAVSRTASWTTRNWLRNWASVPVVSMLRRTRSQKRRRTGSSG